MVGLNPYFVQKEMDALERQCQALIDVHAKWKLKTGKLPDSRVALLRFVSSLALILERFLTIHPYMDGNGHSARILIFVMMAREGYFPKHWNVDAKQPYGNALYLHRRGKPGELCKFLLETISGP